MDAHRLRLPSCLLVLAGVCATASAASFPGVSAPNSMVVADNVAAASAGLEALADGGDAVDAAVVTTLMLGVHQPFASGLGGGGFAVVYRRAERNAYALDFREVAPARAHRDMFLTADGEIIPYASTRGPLAAGVPGELAGLYALHAAHGKLPWARVVAPALRAARDGFPVGRLLHSRVVRKRALLAQRPALARLFLDKDLQPLAVGARLKRPALARTLTQIAKHGAAPLYTGQVGRALALASSADGGLLQFKDLRDYQPKTRQVVRGTFRGHTVLSMPPPSSGGAVLIQALRVLDAVDLKALGHNSSAYLHRLAETLKHGFADRARWMGDPDFTPVPLARLLSNETIQHIQDSFNPDKTLPKTAYGVPVAVPEDGGTSHLSIVDAAGNAIALTSTVNTSFGALYIAGDTGVLLNNQMDDFVAKPGVPNSFGLVGRAANAVAPGKRPLSSMSPTVVLKGDDVALVLGASGGPTIITGTLQVLLNVLVFNMDPRAAVEAPRIHHQWLPERIYMESEISEDVRRALTSRGHTVTVRPRYNAVQVVVRDANGWVGAADPAKLGAAVGR